MTHEKTVNKSVFRGTMGVQIRVDFLVLFLVWGVMIRKTYGNALIIDDMEFKWSGDCVLLNILNDREICCFLLSLVYGGCSVHKPANYDLTQFTGIKI